MQHLASALISTSYLKFKHSNFVMLTPVLNNCRVGDAIMHESTEAKSRSVYLSHSRLSIIPWHLTHGAQNTAAENTKFRELLH